MLFQRDLVQVENTYQIKEKKEMKLYGLIESRGEVIVIEGTFKYLLSKSSTLGRTRKVIPPLWYKEGVDGTPPWIFDMWQRLSKTLYLQWKAFEPLDKMRYILQVILSAILDFTKS